MFDIDNLLQAILSPYVADPKWYPYVLIIVAILGLVILYIIFMYIRSFVIWILGVQELIALQKEQIKNTTELIALQSELLEIQEEQRAMLEYLIDLQDLDEENINDDDLPHTTSTNDIENKTIQEDNSWESEEKNTQEKPKKKWFSK